MFSDILIIHDTTKSTSFIEKLYPFMKKLLKTYIDTKIPGGCYVFQKKDPGSFSSKTRPALACTPEGNAGSGSSGKTIPRPPLPCGDPASPILLL